MTAPTPTPTPTPTPAPPVVSVVLATYNRSNILRYAIESVLAQTLPAFELVVVGDACTDDTETVVASFDDPRIRFVSLGRNFGDQSGPNNVGALLARADRIAYLNHDDLFFPDHLEHAVHQLAHAGADLLFTRMAIIRPLRSDESSDGRPVVGGEPWVVDVHGVTRARPWWLSSYQPASSWVCRREVIEQLGGWRPAGQLHAYSSQELLFRARRAGYRIVGDPELTVLALPSSFRTRAYADRLEDDSRLFATELTEHPAELRRQLLTAAASASPTLAQQLRLLRSEAVHRAVAAVGINPKELRYRLRGKRPGEFFAELRRTRGLDEEQR